MKFKSYTLLFFLLLIISLFSNFNTIYTNNEYQNTYFLRLHTLNKTNEELISTIKNVYIDSKTQSENLKTKLATARHILKAFDIWMRYLEPVAYKQINGPLPVEWETEVHEKHEKPYKRIGSGYTLAMQYLDNQTINKDTLLSYFYNTQKALLVYQQDSITKNLASFDHFLFANRLHLLNLATIYTTGFECTDTAAIVPELYTLINTTKDIYTVYNQTFSDKSISDNYLKLYAEMVEFVNNQPTNYSQFNHYLFIKKYVNVLYYHNQQLILKNNASSKSFVDYSINKQCETIFSKNLYKAQQAKGVFLRVNDKKELAIIKNVGKMLFYDPILSKNNQRSCASCHFPTQFFTDTTRKTAQHFNKTQNIDRNTPSLINANAYHLLMHDGKHINLQNQCKDVITNANEMASNANEVISKIMSCKIYNKTFKSLLKHTPQETNITFEHIVSAITLYYTTFSQYNANFDDVMNNKTQASAQVIKGFNVFMSKAQCATCHFLPQFNGTKPPYTGSEFEVLGTPADKNYKNISPDAGRHSQNQAQETYRAFRTSTLKNVANTKPYMHNGVFDTLDEVINFYNTGGGATHGFDIDNQTLTSDSLHLTKNEIADLKIFINSLTENIAFDTEPNTLPKSNQKSLNIRK